MSPKSILSVRALLAALSAALLAAAPARAEWLRAESPHFVAYRDGSESVLRQRLVQLEEFDQLLRMLTRTDGARTASTLRLPIYFVDGIGGLRQVRPVRQDTAGFYTASAEGIAAFASEQGQDRATRDMILFHEYAHHFMLQHFPAAYPSWYVEGFAEYVSTVRFENNRIALGAWAEGRAVYLVDRSGWLPFERLLFGNTTGMTRHEVAKFYAQSWLLVHYLLRDPGRTAQLLGYLAGTGRGEDRRASFERLFGVSPLRMQEQLIDYAGCSEITYCLLSRPDAAAPNIEVTELPRSADDLILLDAAVRVGLRRSAESYLQRIRSAARGHDDPFAKRALARVEALHGDGAAADRLLDPMIERSPDDADLLYLKGARHLSAAQRDPANAATHLREAQRWFVRAHRSDPNHVPTLYRYAQSLSAEANFMSENTQNILLLAHQLAPQSNAVTIAAANLSMRRGLFAEAEVLLTSVASNRHGGATAQMAAQLLDKARARDNQGLPGIFELPSDEV